MPSKEIATVFFFESTSTPGKTYQTILYVDGSTSCECPGWTFKRKTTPGGGRSCKHVRDVDAGMGNRHAIRVVEYATSAKRRPQLAMEKPMLQPTGRAARAFDFTT